MKNHLIYRLTTIGILFFVFSLNTAFGQIKETKVISAPSQTETWIGALVNAAGENSINGVNVFFKAGDCSEPDIVLVKFVNTNNTDVLIEWANGIYTLDKKWIHDERREKQKEINIQPGKTTEGNCNAEKSQGYSILKFNLNELALGLDNVLKFAPSYIEVTKL